MHDMQEVLLLVAVESARTTFEKQLRGRSASRLRRLRPRKGAGFGGVQDFWWLYPKP